jgi:hypothetical protein
MPLGSIPLAARGLAAVLARADPAGIVLRVDPGPVRRIHPLTRRTPPVQIAASRDNIPAQLSRQQYRQDRNSADPDRRRCKRHFDDRHGQLVCVTHAVSRWMVRFASHLVCVLKPVQLSRCFRSPLTVTAVDSPLVCGPGASWITLLSEQPSQVDCRHG